MTLDVGEGERLLEEVKKCEARLDGGFQDDPYADLQYADQAKRALYVWCDLNAEALLEAVRQRDELDDKLAVALPAAEDAIHRQEELTAFVERVASLDPDLGPMDLHQLVADAQDALNTQAEEEKRG